MKTTTKINKKNMTGKKLFCIHCGPCEGLGSTREAAILDLKKELRSAEDDEDRADRERGIARDRYGFPIFDDDEYGE